MTESPPQLAKPDNGFPAVDRPGRRRWQFGLRTVFLLMAAIAVWTAHFINRRDIASLKARLETTVPLAHQLILEARIETMAPLAHELIVDDPKQIAVVKLKEHRFDDNRWEIYLPDGTYRLCLATRGITYAGLTPERKSVPITAGRHQLALEQQFDQEVWRITALWDRAKLIGIEEPKVWGELPHSVGGGHYSSSEQLPPDQPLILYRRQFNWGNGPYPFDVPTSGILLWIERSGGAPTKPQ